MQPAGTEQSSKISKEVTSETIAPLLTAPPVSWLALADRDFSLSLCPTDKTMLKGRLPRPTRQSRGGRGPQPLRSQTPHTVSPSRGTEREEGEEHRLEAAQTKQISSLFPNPGRPASGMVTIHLRKSHSASEALGQVEKPSWALGSSLDSTLMCYVPLRGSLLPHHCPAPDESHHLLLWLGILLNTVELFVSVCKATSPTVQGLCFNCLFP